MWYVYFLRLSNGDLYVGSTNDLRRRVASHESGNVTSTAVYRPVQLESYVAVVVAELIRESPTELQSPTELPEAGPDEIVVRWPWVLTFAVEQVLAGRITRDAVTVVASMHTNFNPEIRRHLLLLRKGEDGRFGLVAHEYKVVEDRRGRFVVPVAEPVASDWIEPKGWVPADYKKRLPPLHYPPRDAWWFEEPYSDLAEVDPMWADVSNGRLVAKRGLALDDLKASFAARACRC